MIGSSKITLPLLIINDRTDKTSTKPTLNLLWTYVLFSNWQPSPKIKRVTILLRTRRKLPLESKKKRCYTPIAVVSSRYKYRVSEDRLSKIFKGYYMSAGLGNSFLEELMPYASILHRPSLWDRNSAMLELKTWAILCMKFTIKIGQERYNGFTP